MIISGSPLNAAVTDGHKYRYKYIHNILIEEEHRKRTNDPSQKGGKFIDTQQIFVSVYFMSVRNRYLRFFVTRVWLIRQPVQLANLPNVWFAKDNT